MRLSVEQRELVRQRAERACEYCGVTETDTAGLLTVDHFHPQARGGSDVSENLIYCCHSCNGFKADYWPQSSDDPTLWNPRREAVGLHFVELADGTLFPTTATGAFTLGQLRLNRPSLVAHRLQRRDHGESRRLMTRLEGVVTLLERMSEQNTDLLEESRALLQRQGRLLNLILDRLADGEN